MHPTTTLISAAWISAPRRLLRRPARLLTASAAATALCLGMAAAPASAESTTVHDPAGDHAPPYLDITTVKYNNGLHKLTAIVHGTNLRRESTYVGLHVRALDGAGIDYDAAIYTKLDKPGYVKQLYRSTHTSSVKLHCGMKAHYYPQLDYATFSIPQSCLGTHQGPVRMYAFLELAYSEGGAGERAPAAVLNQGSPV